MLLLVQQSPVSERKLAFSLGICHTLGTAMFLLTSTEGRSWKDNDCSLCDMGVERGASVTQSRGTETSRAITE
jgi:hypothetical protein